MQSPQAIKIAGLRWFPSLSSAIVIWQISVASVCNKILRITGK